MSNLVHLESPVGHLYLLLWAGGKDRAYGGVMKRCWFPDRWVAPLWWPRFGSLGGHTRWLHYPGHGMAALGGHKVAPLPRL
jgi:hypothetical protein